jgi:hypothetical protein
MQKLVNYGRKKFYNTGLWVEKDCQEAYFAGASLAKERICIKHGTPDLPKLVSPKMSSSQ